MITSLGKRAAAAATVFAIGGLGPVVVQAPAHASAFSAAYTCNIAGLGQTAAVLNGWLASPGTAFTGPARFQLHISSMNLQAPVPVDTWTATAWINVHGAEDTTFVVSGGGGAIPAQGAIAGDLAGDWAPVVGGTDLMSVGGIEIMANSAEAGNVTVQCVPNGAPVAEVLQVAVPYAGPWIRPAAPIFHIGGWYHPGMTLHRPVWLRPGRPYYPGGWNRPGVPVHPGGWNRPGEWNHPGGWNNHPGGWNRPGEWHRPGEWNHPGGWNNHPGGWNRPGGWNHPGTPGHPGAPGHAGGPEHGTPHHHGH
jgi:hypothetical protein